MEKQTAETIHIVEIGCGFEENVKKCWLDQGLASAMSNAFPNQILEVTGLDLWWDPKHDFTFPHGNFKGTMEEKTLPPEVDAIIWRNPNPVDIIEIDAISTDGVLSVVTDCIQARLKKGGKLFFETDLKEPLAQAIEEKLIATGLIRKAQFKSPTSFYETTFGAEYEKLT